MCFLIAANHIVEDKKKVEEQVKSAYQKLTDSSELIQNTSSSEDSVRNAVWSIEKRLGEHIFEQHSTDFKMMTFPISKHLNGEYSITNNRVQ